MDGLKVSLAARDEDCRLCKTQSDEDFRALVFDSAHLSVCHEHYHLTREFLVAIGSRVPPRGACRECAATEAMP
jgi:hypothetical protein